MARSPTSLDEMTTRAWLLFAAVGVLWGLPYLFIKIAVVEFSPAFLAWARIVLAGLVLLPFALRSGALKGLLSRRGPITAFAIFEIVVPFPLIAFGEQHVSSSLAAILVASLPLVVALLSLRFDPSERVSGSRFVGIVVGLFGVIALLGIDVASDFDALSGAVAILAATVAYAIGPMIVKRHLQDVSALGAVTAAFGVASVILLPAALLSPPATVPSTRGLVALGVLALVCTALAFVLYFALIARVGPSRASIITYINPAVAVAAGVLFLGEKVTGASVAALLLILAGSWLGTDGRVPPGLAAIAATISERKQQTQGASR